MARIRKREAATRDITAQWVWYAETGGIALADRFLNAVENTLELLSVHPESGSKIVFLKAELQDLRKFPVSDGFEKILLFYFPRHDGVDLVRVVHANRVLERLLVEGT